MKIIMYHYVHNKEEYNVSLKSLSVHQFEKQIRYLKKNYDIIDPSIFFSIIEGKKRHKNYVLLTFDDGYKDHIKNVEPILDIYNIKALFFISTSTLKENSFLDVNKIQILLEKFNDDIELIRVLKKELDHTTNINFEYKNPNSFDNNVRSEIKNLLQWKIENKIRTKLLDDLFNQYCKDEINSTNFYMNLHDLKSLVRKGHHIGLHTHNHNNLMRLGMEEQKIDIIKSLNYLKKSNLLKNPISFCYPYGQYNLNTLKILKNLKIKYGFKIGNKDFNRKYNYLEIPRIDTKLI